MPVAGQSFRDLLGDLLRALNISVLPSSDEGPLEQWIWVQGSFPLLDLDTLLQLLNHAEGTGYAWAKGTSSGHLLAGTKPLGFSSELAPEAWAQSQGLEPLMLDPIPLQCLMDASSHQQISQFCFYEKRQALIEAGIFMTDTQSVWIDRSVQISPGCSIEPNVRIRGKSQIGENVQIGMGCVIQDSRLGDGVLLKPYCVVDNAQIEQGAEIGPFAHLRPKTRLGPKTRIGNFVETKNVLMGEGSKASHLAYLGDAVIGRDCNMGAGVITCNYDGYNKHQTTVGDRVFVGSDSQLVAPVTLGDDAFVGAGSTITFDVPANALALSRTRQVNRENLAESVREKAREKKSKA
ncbi:MAG: hypothetical protein H6510_06280 [Acidobacteria bacterium]|nr:hypothetical protein [Acidobacteriota bacterium]